MIADPCDACGAEPGEDCGPGCIGAAAAADAPLPAADPHPAGFGCVPITPQRGSSCRYCGRTW